MPRHGRVRHEGPKEKRHTAKQLGLQLHGVKRVGDLIVVRLDLSCRVRKPWLA